MQTKDAKRKFNRLKREQESRENDKDDELIVDNAKRLDMEVVGDDDQSKSKSRSVRQRKAKIEITVLEKSLSALFLSYLI